LLPQGFRQLDGPIAQAVDAGRFPGAEDAFLPGGGGVNGVRRVGICDAVVASTVDPDPAAMEHFPF
jgi:hypothetical protein